MENRGVHREASQNRNFVIEIINRSHAVHSPKAVTRLEIFIPQPLTFHVNWENFDFHFQRIFRFSSHFFSS